MITPSWLADTLAALVLATAAYCAGRIAVSLLRGRRIELDADLTHILMGIGMAGMFVTRLAFLDDKLWAIAFGTVAAWYVVRIALETSHAGGGLWTGVRHHAGHVVSALAMLYMNLALPAASSSSPMGSMDSMGSGSTTAAGMGASLPTVALVFALVLVGYAVLVADRIPLSAVATSPDPAPGHGISLGHGALLAPRGTAVCEVVMSVAMGVMLIAML